MTIYDFKHKIFWLIFIIFSITTNKCKSSSNLNNDKYRKEYTIEKLRKQALQLGKIGQLKEAVEVFKSILDNKLENEEIKSDVKLLNNAGVAQMKYGLQLLAESEKHFQKGLKVDPSYTKAAKNLKRVQQILQSKIIEPKSGKKGNMYSSTSNMASKRIEKDFSIKTLKKYFQNWLFENDMKRKVTIAMGSRKPIQIQNALKKDFADKIHKELFDSQSYYVREGYRSLYQFHFSAFYNNDIDEFVKHPNLSLLHDMLASDYVFDWISDVSASDVDHLVTSASLYRPGDYVMPHTDINYDADTRTKRRVAYILHMASQWKSTFGGELIMMNPITPIAPMYNAITLFPVSSSSYHFVAPVAQNVPYPKYKRLAVSGWFQTTNLEQAEYMETLGDNDLTRYQQFSIDGKTGANLLPTPEMNDKDLETSLKQGPIYVDQEYEDDEDEWNKCVGDNVNNNCHNGKVIDQASDSFEIFDGQNDYGQFLNGKDEQI